MKTSLMFMVTNSSSNLLFPKLRTLYTLAALEELFLDNNQADPLTRTKSHFSAENSS